MSDSNEIIKFIIEELGKEPFNLDFNIASFGSLDGTTLLRVLHNVLCSIYPKYKDESGNESTLLPNGEIEISRVLEVLRILRYWNGPLVPEKVKQALVVPVAETIWEIIAWLLVRKDELKERAYLANYLVKVQVPEDIMMDEDVETCFQHYKAQIEQFTETHRRWKELQTRTEQRSVSELVNDLTRIEHDTECLSRKVEHWKTKMESSTVESLLSARELRKARDTKFKLQRQLENEESKLDHFGRRGEILHLQMQDMMDLNDDGNADTTLNRLEQNAEILKHIVQEKLPAQIDGSKRTYLALRITEENPPFTKEDLEFRRQRAAEVAKDIEDLENLLQQLVSRKSESQDALNFLNFMKEQIEINFQRKTLLHFEFKEITEDLHKLVQEKRQIEGKDEDGTNTLKGYKDYVKQMRKKSALFKEMRSELQKAREEVGILSATKYLVEGELQKSLEDWKNLEERFGLTGIFQLQEDLEKVSHEKSSTEKFKLDGIQTMANMAKTVNALLWEGKSKWQSLASKVKALRVEACALEKEKIQAEETMKSIMAPVHVNIESWEQALQENLGKWKQTQKEYINLKSEIPIMKTELDRAFGISGGRGPRVGNNIDRVLVKVLECERIHKQLEIESNQLEDLQKYDLAQKDMWTDLSKLLQVKAKVLKREMSADSVYSWKSQPNSG